MNATAIKTEIEKLSGYSFQDFQTRARSLAFDCALVMQQVKQKYGRLITGSFLQNELGFTSRFVDSYKAVKKSKIGKCDPGFKTKYLQELQREADKKSEKKSYNGLPIGKYSAGKYRTYKTKENAKTFVK